MFKDNQKSLIKILVTAIMVLALALGLCACGVSISTDDNKNKQDTQQNSQQNNSAQQSAPANNQQSTKISMDEAKAIATKDAGYDVSGVTFVKQEQDFDDGIQKFEIEFVVGTTKFEYDVDANSGQIIKRERESVYDD
ncbi:MAG: PepSY domain-containing protein [Coriobacteriales bacterium]|nr:PepSY domain-containing protein [Coriobacteriales bacterium]